jgi:excisionase family DNA binding protein
MKQTNQQLFPPVSPYMTKAETGRYLGNLSVATVEDLIKSGRLAAMRISYKLLRVSKAECDRFMESTRTVGPLGDRVIKSVGGRNPAKKPAVAAAAEAA